MVMVIIVNGLSKIVYHNTQYNGSNPVRDNMKIHTDALRIPFITDSR
jgi:hypothetical protein